MLISGAVAAETATPLVPLGEHVLRRIAAPCPVSTWRMGERPTAERHPGLKLIVDHMGVPRAHKGMAAYRFQPELLFLAKHPNVAVKATGQAGYAEDEYPFRSLHPHLHRCFDAFGPERMFWGTDITRMPCSWRQCVTLFTEELPWLKRRDLYLVMGEVVCNWIGWPLSTGGKPRRRPRQTRICVLCYTGDRGPADTGIRPVA